MATPGPARGQPPAVLIPAPASFALAFAIAFPPFRLAQSDAPLLAIGHEKALLLNVAQHAFSHHLRAKSLEQLLLRLATPQFNRRHLKSPPFIVAEPANRPA
jgi:hypothetical protein